MGLVKEGLFQWKGKNGQANGRAIMVNGPTRKKELKVKKARHSLWSRRERGKRIKSTKRKIGFIVEIKPEKGKINNGAVIGGFLPFDGPSIHDTTVADSGNYRETPSHSNMRGHLKKMRGIGMKTLLLTGLVAMLSINVANAASDYSDTQFVVHRYTNVTAVPTAAQQNLMHVVVQLVFPPEVQTVGDAINYALSRSGYRLAPNMKRDIGMGILASQPLPTVDRRLGPVSLQDALIALAGPAYDMNVNDLMRTIAFVVKKKYQGQLASIAQQKKNDNGIMKPDVGNEIKSSAPLKTVNKNIIYASLTTKTNPSVTSNSDTKISADTKITGYEGVKLRVINTAKKAIAIPPSPFLTQAQIQSQNSSDSQTAGAQQYGPVKANENLMDIATKVSPSQKYSIYQVMLAIRDMNPACFKNGNINSLYVGSILKIPAEDKVASYNKHDARITADQQYQDWLKDQKQQGNS